MLYICIYIYIYTNLVLLLLASSLSLLLLLVVVVVVVVLISLLAPVEAVREGEAAVRGEDAGLLSYIVDIISVIIIVTL